MRWRDTSSASTSVPPFRTAACTWAATSRGSLFGTSGDRTMSVSGPGIGYWLHPRWAGRGPATESVRALVRQGLLPTDVDHVEIRHDAAGPGKAGVEVVWRAAAAGRGAGG
ncbi:MULTISPECIES: GNAT family N-acetyltransferase [unclassified Streptomyces]|uniref:GNAT family N-acetyltransferase n=1 Tax=unclassified Streptomyces TaxID=2593676 RepID=UPI00364CFAFD